MSRLESKGGVKSVATELPSTPRTTVSRPAPGVASAAIASKSTVPRTGAPSVGESISTGMPVMDAHATGDLEFGRDGSLLASCGEGGSAPGSSASAIAVAEGMMLPKDRVPFEGDWPVGLLQRLRLFSDFLLFPLSYLPFLWNFRG